MNKLDDILAGMDQSLFETDPEDEEQGDEAPSVYQENVPYEVAQAILTTEDLDPLCTYQLITTEFEQVLVKIDNRITEEEEEAAVAKDPMTKHRHRTEYVIASSDTDYSDIYQDMALGKDSSNLTYNSDKINKEKKSIDYRYILFPILGVLFTIGIALLYFTLKFAK